MLLLVSRDLDPRAAPEAVALHAAAILANPSTSVPVYNVTAEAMCTVSCGPVADSAEVLALQLPAYDGERMTGREGGVE